MTDDDHDNSQMVGSHSLYSNDSAVIEQVLRPIVIPHSEICLKRSTQPHCGASKSDGAAITPRRDSTLSSM